MNIALQPTIWKKNLQCRLNKAVSLVISKRNRGKAQRMAQGKIQ